MEARHVATHHGVVPLVTTNVITVCGGINNWGTEKLPCPDCNVVML